MYEKNKLKNKVSKLSWIICKMLFKSGFFLTVDSQNIPKYDT